MTVNRKTRQPEIIYSQETHTTSSIKLGIKAKKTLQKSPWNENSHWELPTKEGHFSIKNCGETEGYAGKKFLSMKKCGMRYGCCLNSNYKTKLLKNYESLLNFGINLGINIILVLIPSVFPVSVRDTQGQRQEEGTTHPPLSLSPSIPLRHSLSLSLHCARLEH